MEKNVENTFSHLDQEGKVRMVDVTEKEITPREATAQGKVIMNPSTLRMIQEGAIQKGDVFTTAKIAAIMGAKKTSELIPMCHPLELTNIEVSFRSNIPGGEIVIEATVRNVGRTGVEMEAMTAVSIAALTIYDMCKSADKSITLSHIRLLSKRGGRSGFFLSQEDPGESRTKTP